MLDLSVARTSSPATAYLADLSHTLRLVPEEPLAEAIEALLAARRSGRRVFVMGNGGSAATASHFVCDLVKTASVAGRRPLRVFGLTDNTPLLTAWANDAAYERAFAEQVAALVEADDVVIAISASGNSPNILAGLRAAAERGARTIGLVGFDGGHAGDLVDIAIIVPCRDYGQIEDAHAAIGHAMTVAVRDAVRAAPTE
jgi:D-sedoheptulose 7-phosphate isomerase